MPRVDNSAGSKLRLLLLVTLIVAGVTACGGTSENPANSRTTESMAESTSTTAEPGPPAGAQLIGLVDLDVGDCFDVVSDSRSLSRAAWRIDCPNPHSSEVYAKHRYERKGSGSGMPYPGSTTVQDIAEQLCYADFEEFVGIRWTISDLDIRTWWPTAESWDQGDRTIICAVTPTGGGKLTGTQARSGR